MKPTENQIKLANAIADEIRYFGMTNDINSPSHHTLISEAVNDMVEGNFLKESDRDETECIIDSIRHLIRTNG